MNSASYHTLVISTALCRVSISTRVLSINKISTEKTHEFWKEKKKTKSTDNIMQVGPLMLNFVFALSLIPLCQNAASSHNTLDRLFIAHIITLLAISHSLQRGTKPSYKRPLDVPASAHQFNAAIPWKIIKESCSQEKNPVAGILAAVERRLCWWILILHFLSARYIFYFLCNICFWFPGFEKFLKVVKPMPMFRVCWYYVQ